MASDVLQASPERQTQVLQHMRVLIVTCDKYSWCVPNCLHFIAKNWPDCPWPIDVLGGAGALKDYFDPQYAPEVRTCFSGNDEKWASLLLDHLEKASPYELFLLLLEDYLVSDKIDTERIRLYADILAADSALDFLRLNACPGPEGALYNNYPHSPLAEKHEWQQLGHFRRGQDYNVSLQPTIFRPSFFRQVLKRDWGPFDVEIEGTKIVNAFYPLDAIGTYDTAFPVTNLIRRGEIEPNAAKWMKENW